MSERLINTNRSADLATHKILVEGEQITQRYQVMNMVVEKEINRIPMAKIVMLDGDPAAQDFELSNLDLFEPGKEIEIKAGYHSEEETVFRGIVIKHKLKIRNNQSFLIVECRDKAIKLSIGRKSSYFYDSKDSEVVEEIINKYNIEHVVEGTTVTHKELIQYQVSDWDFLVTRAQANGKICVVNDGQIEVKKPEVDQEPLETVSYGATLLDFDAEIDARNQFQKVTSYGWKAGEQSLLEAEAAPPNIQLNGNITPEDLAKVVDLDNLELKNGGGDNASLQEWANAKAVFNQLAKVRGRLKFQGISSVKPNTILKLEGVGNRFNGNVYISGIRHQITEGNWTVDAEFGLNPKWFSETYDINDSLASGLTAAVHGLQIGLVTQLENDPDDEFRILVRFPTVDSESEGIWARIATLDAGNNRGTFFRPEIDDEVIVGFINDNPNEAIVLGMLNSSVKPAPLEASDDNHEKGLVTRSGIKLIFNDEKKSVNIETPGGKKVSIDDDNGVISFEDENANKLLLDSNGIKLDSPGDIKLKATGDVSIEGMNVNLKASAQFKAEGAAGAKVSSNATATLKGALVKIN